MRPPFLSARKAVERIPDGACVFSAGIGSHGRCPIFYWALRDRFLETGQPANLTWIGTVAQGGRGRVPGTIEEIALAGLVTEYVSSHMETARAFLRLAEEGKITLQTLPYGELTWLLEAQGRGEAGVRSQTGIGTFLDPAVGGTTLLAGKGESRVRVEGDQRYWRIPKVEVALLVAPYADREGNIYFQDASCITDPFEGAEAAWKNGGEVYVSVSRIIPREDAAISIPAEKVTGIVVNPWSEQTGGIRQRRPLRSLLPGADVDGRRELRALSLANRMAGVTPARGKMDAWICRVARALFLEHVVPGGLVNFGVGLPEEVGRLLLETGTDAVFTTEAGAWGESRLRESISVRPFLRSD